MIEKSGVVEEVEKLLWFSISAEGPEAGSAATSENQGIVVAHLGHSIDWGADCQNRLVSLFLLG